MSLHHATREYARSLDESDPLAEMRLRFAYPLGGNGPGTIYFCGNSLGLQPKSVRRHIDTVLRAWADRGVAGHFEGPEPWVDYQDRLNEQLAGIVGALPHEVAVMNALTVNLHFLLVSFYRPTPHRYRILIEGKAFPSDRYAVQSHLALHGYATPDALVELGPRTTEEVLRTEDIEAYLHNHGESVALVLFGGVQYYTGQAFDLPRITRAAHAAGCMAGFDLAHAVGNVPLALHDWGVDFAAWCSYKYLNAGPGSPGGVFIHERHVRDIGLPRFAGWWGQERTARFAMGPHFEPIPSAQGWQVSNHPMLSMAGLRASLDIFGEAGFPPLRRKSEQLTSFLEFLLNELCGDAIRVLTPRDPAARGAQLSVVAGPEGRRVFDRLQAGGVVCDWREPDVIRLAPVPLYNTYQEVYQCAVILRDALGAVA